MSFFTDDCTVTFTANCLTKGTAILAFHLKCNAGLQLLYIPPTSTGFYEKGWSVAADRAQAVRWYKRATATGHSGAADRLKRLGA